MRRRERENASVVRGSDDEDEKILEEDDDDDDDDESSGRTSGVDDSFGTDREGGTCKEGLGMTVWSVDG